MAEQILEGVKPTRMELLEIRKRLELAEKGHQLLEEKRDALVEKFFEVIKKREEISKKADEALNKAFQNLIEAQMIMGEKRMQEISKIIPSAGEIELQSENIMGVRIPCILKDGLNIKIDKISYSFSDTSAKLDDSVKSFRETLPILLELAETEAAIKCLSKEIEKTKRRVNVLENNIIPRLKATRKYIEMQLEEREREDFFRRKRMKALMEEKAKR
jgi:V/A-type H+-transporting ATPase subunit D